MVAVCSSSFSSAACLFCLLLYWVCFSCHRQGSSLYLSMNRGRKLWSLKPSILSARLNTRQTLMSGETLLIVLQYRPQSRSSIGPSLDLTFVITIGASDTPSSVHRSYVLRTRVTLYIHCACVKLCPPLTFFLVYSLPLLVWRSGGRAHGGDTAGAY
ncbi:hypothetical protein AB205_0154040 [Aquarana catesbeiana]|uniref:Secreted protein n=1 Tax=Aquarana catesbeiana TaxID=8400 RepID=A0A2G9RWU3_AQUCT|nr:hypothetical protein AB205_0154040 [Aquarana catesbeiana]